MAILELHSSRHRLHESSSTFSENMPCKGGVAPVGQKLWTLLLPFSSFYPLLDQTSLYGYYRISSGGRFDRVAILLLGEHALQARSVQNWTNRAGWVAILLEACLLAVALRPLNWLPILSMLPLSTVYWLPLNLFTFFCASYLLPEMLDHDVTLSSVRLQNLSKDNPKFRI